MTLTASTPTEDRRLIAEVSQWRKDNGWTDTSFGWVDDLSTVRVRPLEHGFQVYRMDDGRWMSQAEYPAATVREAVDMLVALGILPARFSSAYRAGWLNAYAEAVTDSMPAATPTNPDRCCQLCGATSGLILLPGNPLTGAGRAHECADGCKAVTR